MNAPSGLVSEIKFRERRRGYDHEEVDNYVKTVSRAAAQAKERIAELERRLARFESQAGTDAGGTEIRETLLRTLVLAQRTADSAVSEARSEAKSITDSAKERAAKTVSEAEAAANERLRSAEERADRMLAESKENGQLIVAEAKRTAAAELDSQRERAQRELADLEASKSELETVVAEIQARLHNERDMLRSLAASFLSFVEKFEPGAGIPEPGGGADSGAQLGEGAGPAGAGGQDPAAEDTSTDGDGSEDLQASDDGVAGGEQARPGAAGDTGANPVVEADLEAAAGSAPESRPAASDTAQAHGGFLQEALSTGGVDAETLPELPVVSWDETVGRIQPEAADTAALAPDVVRSEAPAGGHGAANRAPEDSRRGHEAASAGPATMPLGADSPALFDMDAEEDDEFIQQLRRVVSSDARLPDGDAAMAAFFDHDDRAGPGRPARRR